MQVPSTPVRTSPAVTLNRPQLDELRRAHGIETEVELARIIGVNPATLYRLSKGEPVSAGFIARVKLAFPAASFDSLFNVRTAEALAS